MTDIQFIKSPMTLRTYDIYKNTTLTNDVYYVKSKGIGKSYFELNKVRSEFYQEETGEASTSEPKNKNKRRIRSISLSTDLETTSSKEEKSGNDDEVDTNKSNVADETTSYNKQIVSTGAIPKRRINVSKKKETNNGTSLQCPVPFEEESCQQSSSRSTSQSDHSDEHVKYLETTSNEEEKSGNDDEVDKNKSNVADETTSYNKQIISTGAIPKRRINVSEKKEINSGTSLQCPVPFQEESCQQSSSRSTSQSDHSDEHMKCKTQDPENMTSVVQLSNLKLGKDVLDNGLSLYNSGKLDLLTTKDRLKTFKNWPNKRIEPKKLAEAGFFYYGRGDVVECFECGIKGHNWVESDKPMEDHRKWNRNCPFVRENTTEHDNISVRPSRPGQDICGNLGVEILPNSRPEDYTEAETRPEKKRETPAHEEHITYENRFSTFENWPKCMQQKPPELAKAGFFYLGLGDQTVCFFCGGGLKHWDKEDDPWEQHALWFPKCNFLLLKKGHAFVEAVHKKHEGILQNKQEEKETEASCSSSSDTKETVINSSSTEDVKSETTVCKICFNNQLEVVLVPCGHMACVDCTCALKKCAFCRTEIQATVRAFLN